MRWLTRRRALALCAAALLSACGDDTQPAPTDASGGTSADAHTGTGDVGGPPADAGSEDTFAPKEDGAGDTAATDVADTDAAAVDTMMPDSSEANDGAATVDGGGVNDASADGGGGADTTLSDDGQVFDSQALDGQTSGADGGSGDSGSGDAGAADTADGSAPVGSPEPWTLKKLEKCDAGDRAWAVRALAFIAGRRPHGQAELDVLTSFVGKLGRPAVAAMMASGPRYRRRWTDWLMEELRIARSGSRSNRLCYGAPQRTSHDGSLAAWMKTGDPATSKPTQAFNMADVITSSLILDDVSVVYEAQLFARLSRPSTRCDNPKIAQVEAAIRESYGQVFREVYLHRNTGCVGCHNAVYSTTNDPDPKLDRFWPIPGRFEKAVFGNDSGKSETILDGVHRYYGFAEGGLCAVPAYCSSIAGSKLSPWGMETGCAVVAAPGAVGKDIYGPSSYWVTDQGATGSTWTLFASFRKGLALLSQGTKPTPDPNTAELPGDHAFAYLWAIRVAHQVWFEAFGHSLTLTHFFPRNAQQRDILESLANAFVDSKLSFSALLVTVATHPLFNLGAPDAACDAGSAYLLPAVFAPFSKEAPAPGLRLNSPGDGLSRWSAPALIGMIDDLLQWPSSALMPTPTEAAPLRQLGVRFNADSRGYRGTGLFELAAWEARYGACAAPSPPQAQQSGGLAGLITMSCKDRCNVNDGSPGLCWCDAACQTRNDCCTDFSAQCGAFFKANPPKPPAPDWLEGVLAAAPKDVDVRTLVRTVKDRIVTQRTLTVEEEALVAKLLGVSSLAVKASAATGLEAGLRLYCGVLLRSPQLTLAGMPNTASSSASVVATPGETPKSLCEAWLALVTPTSTGWACSSAGLLSKAP